MGIQVALRHRTFYRYDIPVALGPQIVRLRPGLHCRTPILSYSLDVTPAEHSLSWQLDPSSNQLARVIFQGRTTEFAVDVNLIADLSPINPFEFLLDPSVEQHPFNYGPELASELHPYLIANPPGPLLQTFVESFRGPIATVKLLLAMNRKVCDEISYVTRLEYGIQTSEQTLQKRSGSCRDSALLLVECLRNLGIAGRFVSGYLIQLAEAKPAPADSKNGSPADSADLHAWAEAFLPGAGWIGLDPTSGLLATEGHIPLACTSNASLAAPISGTAERKSVQFSYEMSVRRLSDSRPSLPVDGEEQWLRVRQVAHQVDADLELHDARLTQGGEPTYVGVENPESPQWNIDALGDDKRTRGLALIQALRERVAPGGLLHYGQGKWYPGEQLPRWALSCFWRLDGVPVWEDVGLIARENQRYSFEAADGLMFINALTRRLGVQGKNILAAYDGEATTEPAGYVVPVRRRQAGGRLYWSSQWWFPSLDRIVLLWGDSPIGYRIPTEAAPWIAPDPIEYEFDEAPFGDRVKLPPVKTRRMDLFETDPKADPLPAVLGNPDTARELIRPFLCVQVRDGRLHVSLPYAPILADYFDLVSAVEDTSKYLGTPVWIEGYAPAPDPRLRSFSVTPDPGVLEINLPPAETWIQLEEFVNLVDEEARHIGLISEKFNFNGDQDGTGGGSHIVIGGATVADSPILRRPDLLRSMIVFWQNHPSLSYLFSGMYVGPTSQYPRVDEARMDALYELELAFSHLPKGGDRSPEIMDGLFRNLLADVTGNTHRAEFCVDKLFPPEGLGLQLGLLELRAFEMPPNARMGLLQMLLVRALVCAFFKAPFRGSLIRWGPVLHDRFMLHHFIEQDLLEVLAHLQRSGFAFEPDWFASHLAFRFPKIGSIAAQGVELELRRALEPWNVLAEETSSGRTVRSVDSSIERIQIKVSGTAAESRYMVACNGRRVPLQPAHQPGVALAAVRFRARKLSSTLHPTVPVHAPLTFSLIDRLTEQTIAQCMYRIEPPVGRVYQRRPANAAEALERRLERFEVISPVGSVPIPPEEFNSTFPGTLDLRIPSPSLHAPIGTEERLP